MAAEEIVILGAARTAMGAFLGGFARETAPELGAAAIRAALAQAGMAPERVDEAVMGCVLPAGLGQAPARQAAIRAGLPAATPCATLNKVCGSGMKAAMIAHDAIRAGSARVVVAGGMESMTNAPHLLEKGRISHRPGEVSVRDHMFVDGLEDAYDKGRSMGSFAEDCAERYQFTREAQDAYAIGSVERARAAAASGAFAAELVVHAGLRRDEQPQRADPVRIPTLRPVFREGGTVTAGNASPISDGAAALVLADRAEAERLGAAPLARILGHASHAQEPGWFTTAPIFAIHKLRERLGWSGGEVDLYEINEAFAVVAMAAMRDLDIARDRINVNGGACALGHPIGCSGARIVVTLVHALRARGLRRGIAAICIGGGEATALAVEII
jgi:acetyl-CoA C-acetyltransferase